MREVGIDIGGQQPKVLRIDAVERADVVVTMGCGDACPVFPGKRYEDWELQDPAGQPIEVVRKVRDDIKVRIEGLISTLADAGGLSLQFVGKPATATIAPTRPASARVETTLRRSTSTLIAAATSTTTCHGW